MKRFYIAPILWGFFLSSVIWAANSTPHLPVAAGLKKVTTLQQSVAVETHARILAIRVEFLPDTLATTTGDGTFGSGLPTDAVIDPLPHDRAYFEDHLTFLDSYFTEVSNGKVTIDTFSVYPLNPDSTYILPHQMWHYNHNTTQEDLNLRLTWLFQDAWSAAAADASIDYDQWDMFVIFHAGVGQDFNVSFDETPHDIPSAYFRLEDLQDALEDPTYPGVLVAVDGADSTFVSSGLLLPESERQSEVDIEIALNGTAALLFGHSIGLPALYNTENGSSGVGRFDLMDQGSGNFAGMIPSRPCAWTRVFMGWETPQVIIPAGVADTLLVNVPGYGDSINTAQQEIYRVDLNPSEYFLIENRSWNPDSLIGYWPPYDMGYTVARDRQGRELIIKEDFTIELQNDDFGVIVEVDNYDFGLPGEGILIWHIDESVIEANYVSNTVNNDLSHRGVALVEADGAEDIGQEYGFLDIGYGAEYGWAGDFFYAGNDAFLDANSNLSAVRFYDDSFPGTRTYDGSPTGLMLGGFAPRDTVMHFWIMNNWAQPGFPMQLAEPSGELSPSALDFDGDQKTDLILALTPGGAIQLFDNLGNAIGDVIETRQLIGLLGDSTAVTDTLLARVDSITGTPAIDVQSDGFSAFFTGDAGVMYFLEYLAGPRTTNLQTLNLTALSACNPVIAGEGTALTAYSCYQGGLIALDAAFNILGDVYPFNEGNITSFCLADTVDTASVFALSDQGEAALVSHDLEVIWVIDLPFIPDFAPLTLFHQTGSRKDLIAVSAEGEVVLLDPSDGSIRSGFPFTTGMTVTAPPVAADFDKDGYLDVVLTGVNRIAAVQVNGVLAANWPLTMDNRQPSEPITSPPAISELMFDDELHVLFGWPGGSVDGRNRWGNSPGGFTRSTSAPVRSAPLLVQLDEDDASELIVLDEDGSLYAWHLQGMGNFTDQIRPWNGLMGGNRRQGVAVPDGSTITPPGQSALVKTKVYPWPNPAKEVVYIRYRTDFDGTVTVRIFDGAGDLVKELSGPAQAGLERDLSWDLADVSSGIYLGRVEAETTAGTDKTFIKIAVIK